MTAVAQPSGEVTLVFSDIEGSTRLLKELGTDAYRETLAEHRRIVRKACGRYAGYEVDYEGDAFFYAFSSASDAVSAVSEAMAGLEDGPIAIRVGIHTGTPGFDPPKYVGMDVHFAARVMSSAHGGQVVLSQATAELVELELTDLGEHRLKDIEQAVSLYQLGDGAFPPLKTISNTNLPRPASSFLGREAELREVLSRIEAGARLVTLTGPGGTGKTRLALEAASSLVPEYKAGVFWVGLASLRDSELVSETIAQVLGSKDGLASHIAEREMLLLLDNLEQVMEAAPELSELLESCPNLTMLVTSRELMRVQGEVEFPVPPLAEPEAVALFCARAQAEPSKEIAELCARLDSLPLAVELAAARTKALTPAQILERLGSRLDLLKGGRDADPRQHTLRATIEWSYELLTPEEQQLFACLSVFAGGCTLEAAEEVADVNLDPLQSLIEKSLLRFTPSDTGGRYWMLETIREYAGERLEESGEAEELRRRHAEWFLELAQESRRPLRGPEQGSWLDRMRREEDNLRRSLAWAIETGHGCLACALAFALEIFWIRAMRWSEAEGWLDRVLQLECAAAPLGRARALATGGVFATSAEVRAARLATSIPVLREHEDREGLAFALRGLSWHLEEAGELRAARLALEEAVGLFEALGHTVTTRRVGLGSLAFREGDHDGARRLLRVALDTGEREGDALGQLDACELLGRVALAEGDLEEAERMYRAGFEAAKQLGDEQVIPLLAGLAAVALRRGRAGEAGGYWGEAERLASEADPRVRKYLEEHALPVGDLTSHEQTMFEDSRASASAATPTP